MGLRTNSMAVGTRAASTPASCPAPVASTGALIPAAASTLDDPVPQPLVETDDRGVRLLPHAERHPMLRAREFSQPNEPR